MTTLKNKLDMMFALTAFFLVNWNVEAHDDDVKHSFESCLSLSKVNQLQLIQDEKPLEDFAQSQKQSLGTSQQELIPFKAPSTLHFQIRRFGMNSPLLKRRDTEFLAKQLYSVVPRLFCLPKPKMLEWQIATCCKRNNIGFDVKQLRLCIIEAWKLARFFLEETLNLRRQDSLIKKWEGAISNIFLITSESFYYFDNFSFKNLLFFHCEKTDSKGRKKIVDNGKIPLLNILDEIKNSLGTAMSVFIPFTERKDILEKRMRLEEGIEKSYQSHRVRLELSSVDTGFYIAGKIFAEREKEFLKKENGEKRGIVYQINELYAAYEEFSTEVDFILEKAIEELERFSLARLSANYGIHCIEENAKYAKEAVAENLYWNQSILLEIAIIAEIHRTFQNKKWEEVKRIINGEQKEEALDFDPPWFYQIPRITLRENIWAK
ncbi:MAG: hypothetical protein LBI95_02070 [Holosporales bacterium]|nr:hypothetical protein [Holosporales bacterium]